MTNSIERKEGLPLPSTLGEWDSKYKLGRSLNDAVLRLHRLLTDDPNYISYLTATWDEQAVEGSLGYDNCMAAGMIRQKAIELPEADEDKFVTKEKLATISKSMGVMLRRYGMSRKERRQTVDGEVVRDGDGRSEV